MIPKLDGTREIVNFNECNSVLLYKNVEYEDYPKHCHTSTEIIMPIENNFTIICNEKPYTLNVGDIFIVSPGVVHSIPRSKGTRFIFLIDLSNWVTLKSFKSILSLIQPTFIINNELFPSVYDECKNIIYECFHEYSQAEPFKEVAIYNKLIHLLLLVGRALTVQNTMFPDSSTSTQQEYSKKFMALCEYINDNCTEDLSVEQAANMLGFSKFHFSRLFKKITGTTFYSYVNERRIAHATLLLMDEETSITEVALNSGFNSISSFIRTFKIQKGCTPTEFRKICSP